MMWENVARDVEDAKNDLSLRRAAALQRHAAELKELDNEHDEIEGFARAASAFAKRYKLQQASATDETKPEGGSAAVADSNADKAEAKPDSRSGFTPNFAGIIRRAS